MEVTSEIQNQICGFAFPVSGSESGAINPKIVCNETGKMPPNRVWSASNAIQSQDYVQRDRQNVAGSCVVCIECYQSQDCVQRDGLKCRRIACGLHRMLSIRDCVQRDRQKVPRMLCSASNLRPGQDDPFRGVTVRADAPGANAAWRKRLFQQKLVNLGKHRRSALT